jgi:zinc transporter ZupT
MRRNGDLPFVVQPMMAPQTALTFAIALLFALIHFAGRRFDFLGGTPRSIWLSLAGGISVAYVFVHILPELAAHQREVTEHLSEGGPREALGSHVYLIALAGLSIFYGLDSMLRRSKLDEQRQSVDIFWIHLGSFAIYNFLVGYLLVHREEQSASGLALFGFALGVHFIVNDQAFRQEHGKIYDRSGRWLLAAMPLGGWLAGVITEIDPLWLSALFAFLAGSIVLNVLKEELPEDRESRFWAFALGTAAYSALLLFAG